jgi:hypothetical protein
MAQMTKCVMQKEHINHLIFEFMHPIALHVNAFVIKQ